MSNLAIMVFWLNAAGTVLGLGFAIMAWLAHDWWAMWMFLLIAAWNGVACWINRDAVL